MLYLLPLLVPLAVIFGLVALRDFPTSQDPDQIEQESAFLEAEAELIINANDMIEIAGELDDQESVRRILVALGEALDALKAKRP